MAKTKLNGVSEDTLAAMGKQYEPSDAVKAAGEEASRTYAALSGAGSANDAAAQQALNAWKNYGDFNYNPDTDILFQNAKANAIANGKVAMQDTIGGASALTGGYANSYAASAGNQAYQNYLKSLDDDLANYYQIALEQYERGKNDLLTEYSLENERGQQAWNKAYSLYGAANDRYNSEQNFDYGKYSDDRSYATTVAGMENTDWWNQENYNLSKIQTDADIAYKQGSLALSQDEFDYKKNQPAAGAAPSYREIDGYISSWSNKLAEAGDDTAGQKNARDTISKELYHLYFEGSISPSVFMNAAKKYLGAEYILDEFSKSDLKLFGFDEKELEEEKKNKK